MLRLTKDYKNWIKEENKVTSSQFAVSSVGKIDPKRHLREHIEELQSKTVLSNFGLMVNAKVF